MRGKWIIPVVVIAVIAVWFAPISIAVQFERRVTVVAVVALSTIWFAAGFTMGRERGRRQVEPLEKEPSWQPTSGT